MCVGVRQCMRDRVRVGELGMQHWVRVCACMRYVCLFITDTVECVVVGVGSVWRCVLVGVGSVWW